MYRNIPISPACSVYISQLIRYARACSIYDLFLIRDSLLKRQVDVTGVSTVSFTGRFPQILRSLQRSSLPVQPSFRPNIIWCVSYQSLSCSWHTDLDYGSYRLSVLEIRLTADVNSRQGMLTPPRHLIPPLVYLEVRVCPHSQIYISYRTYEVDDCSLFTSFHLVGNT
jgi:hypothetical protein